MTLDDASAAADEHEVSELVVRCLERLSAGDSDALDALCAERPEHADELRERLARLEALGLAGDDDERRVGPFVVVGSLGRGGMGEVLLGRQDEPVRRLAAVKIVPAELLHDDSRARFDAERQVLAQLEHPGIARVLEAGSTPEGRPWFAMEYVVGSPITSWCDERAASVDERLDLFLQLCDAMTFAHQNGVLHRDLKPGNVLVTEATGEPTAKVIDFGLAKALDASFAAMPDLTRAGQVMGTPAYMSPEQAAAIEAPTDARTDVWALGVMLHELLCGALPFDVSRVRGFSDFQRMLANDEPVPPSAQAAACSPDVAARRSSEPRALARRLRGDLDAIIAKALATHPAERYASVSQLADDVRRHVGNEVVTAKPATLVERWRKYVRRRGRVAVAGTVGAVGIVVAPFVIGGFYLTAERALRDFDVVADSIVLDRLVFEAEEELFPAAPELVPAIDAWDARLAELADHEPIYDALDAELEALRAPDGTLPSARERLLARELDELRARLDALLAEGGLRDEVAARRAWSADVERVTLDEPADAWHAAIADIADRETSPWYDGLVLEPQLGLIPLGRDPDSQLWEFAHPRPGERLPERGGDCRWIIEDDTCLVFVLVPGGTFRVGSSEHPAATDYFPGLRDIECRAPDVRLDPFFISRYEMTQGQWLRFTGSDPSVNSHVDSPVSLVTGADHPVEGLSWVAAEPVLRQMGLALPTAVQWEYAARAGSQRAFWWPGTARDVGAEFVNGADLTCVDHRIAGDLPADTWRRDGWPGHAPVDWGEPNPFGLHDVTGNVWEWCRDRSVPWPKAQLRPGDGLMSALDPSDDHVDEAKRDLRGGSYLTPVLSSRPARRLFQPKDSVNDVYGVRPSRSVR